MHSNGAGLKGKRVKRGSIAFPIAANNENFMADIIPEQIQEGVAYLGHKSDWDAELLHALDVFETR